jgi:hypothetical protein
MEDSPGTVGGLGSHRFEGRKSAGKQDHNEFHLGSAESPQILHNNVV